MGWEERHEGDLHFEKILLSISEKGQLFQVPGGKK
jgi:hypothetical protein